MTREEAERNLRDAYLAWYGGETNGTKARAEVTRAGITLGRILAEESRDDE